MPLLQEFIGEESKSIGSGSTIRVLAETRSKDDSEDLKLNQSIINAEISEFRRFNPNAKIYVRYVATENLLQEVKFQHSRGLSPDLILLISNNGLPLLRQHFIKSIALSQIERRSIRNSLLPSFKYNGVILGIPIFIYPQLACYNRTRLRKPPENLDELIRLSQNGVTFGIEKNIEALQWIYSGLDEVLFESRTKPSSIMFLRWLKLANLQPTISFESDPRLLRNGLISGEFSWITCNAAGIPSLKIRMGNSLGTVMLPNMPSGKARPYLTARTWFFGSQSSRQQHNLAKRFALFTVNTVQQRNMVLKLETSVSVNPGISLPLKSNNILRLVNFAAERGKLFPIEQADWLDTKGPYLIPYIDLVLSGEQSPEAIAPRLNNLLELEVLGE